MRFLSPIWFGLLLPWAAAAIWMLLARRSGVGVPFIELWTQTTPIRGSNRRLTRPTFPVLAMLLASLLGMMSAAGPKIAHRSVAVDHRAAATTKPKKNVAIVKFAVRRLPMPAAMVRIMNHSDLKRCPLLIQSGTTHLKEEIDLPIAGGVRDFFIDLPAVGEEARARLEVSNNFSPDNAASIATTRHAARVEMDGSVDVETRRVVSAYIRARPAAGNAPKVKVVNVSANLREDEPGIIAAAPQEESSPPRTVTIRPHALTKNLDPSGLRLAGAGRPSGAGWEAVISAHGQPLAEVRDQPARQVWFGFDPVDFSRTPEFVVLWTNALDWTSEISSDDGDHIKPAHPKPIQAVAMTEGEMPVAGWLASFVAMLAVFCAAVAAIFWSRPGHLKIAST